MGNGNIPEKDLFSSQILKTLKNFNAWLSLDTLFSTPSSQIERREHCHISFKKIQYTLPASQTPTFDDDGGGIKYQ